ncbi:MAG: DNA translocase FtsK 4TM domain-containing protein [Nitrospirae bacterium]|nr:DNA translocase FtsK 4TM domain-containing protein [Nitrospirota bacterium]
MVSKAGTKGKRAVGIITVLGSVYLGLSLLSYSKWDPSLLTYTSEPAQNLGGIAGAYISDALMSLIGVSAYSIPLFLCVYGIKGLLLRERSRINLVGAVLFIFSFSTLSGLMADSFDIELNAGIIGTALGNAFSSLLSIVGAYILSIAFVLASLILVSPESFIDALFRLKTEDKEKPEVPEEEYISRRYEPEVFTMPSSLPPRLEEEEGFSYAEEQEELEKKYLPRLKKSGYELPSIELLVLHEDTGLRPTKDETISDTVLLEKRLGDFQVEGKVTQVHIGPVVTMYEFEPAPGVKINRVVSLSDDLALGLKARSVRIAPIPGKATIGIEVPNRYRETVSLREIISSEAFRRSPSALTLALGKDIFGNPAVADLLKMPHLLVAGATGSGKSVSINAMVMSILYKASPAEVKLLLIDPKLLELSAYEDIPHLVMPVVTSPKEAADALKKTVFEMDRRYRLIAEKGARNIEGFNAHVSEEERLPYIVVFIDELADLMFTSAVVVEDSIARLAQMARASGIHLIVATQRPSVDVITGVIKANFPARVSFQVSSKIDSRTILDSHGAEQLIGNGDMLFMLPGARTIRIHGAFIQGSEINAITDFIKAQGRPDYSLFEGIQTVEEQKETVPGERDEIYQRALDFAEAVGEVSISSIQRRFKVGYNRAARIMELMEEDGLVGPMKGAGKPRDFLRKGHRGHLP